MVFAVITKYPHPSDNWIIKALFWFVVCWFFFRINLFEKLFQEYVLSGLILVKAVCKSYQQTTLRDKELNDWEFIASTPILCKNNIGETICVMARLIRVHTNCNKFKKINEVAQFYYNIQLQYQIVFECRLICHQLAEIIVLKCLARSYMYISRIINY